MAPGSGRQDRDEACPHVFRPGGWPADIPAVVRPIRRVFRRAAFTVATVICAGAALVCFGTGREAWVLIHPQRSLLTEAQTAEARMLLADLENVELHTGDGLRLKGWFSPGRAGSGVALVHGLSSNRA